VELGLAGKCALVTAASKGLGRACAEALAAEGARVFIASRTEETCRSAAEAIGAAGYQVADLSRPEVPGRLVEAAVQTLGGLDILVSNAGGPPPGTFDSTPLEAWDTGYELTLMSTVRLCKLALPHLERSGRGRIVVITSTSVREPIPNILLSNAFRSAVVATLKTLAGEVAGKGITVNNIAPGRFLTDRVVQIDTAAAEKEGISREEVTARSARSIPSGRIGDPSELGQLCAYLCSEQAGYITGQTIAIDGGATKGVY